MANYQPKKRAIDEDALHRYLFERVDRHQQILVNQSELARDLGVVKATLWFTIKRMIDDGRMRIARKGQSGRNTYYVVNPDGEDATPKETTTTPHQPRRVMWQ